LNPAPDAAATFGAAQEAWATLRSTASRRAFDLEATGREQPAAVYAERPAGQAHARERAVGRRRAPPRRRSNKRQELDGDWWDAQPSKGFEQAIMGDAVRVQSLRGLERREALRQLLLRYQPQRLPPSARRIFDDILGWLGN
jgi:hypothetical protein